MTIYDISEKAGVSIATVSRVLNGSDRVSEKTKRKVLDIIEQYGYTPNAFARGLGLNTMKTIGLLCADSSDIYMAKAIYFLERLLRSKGYNSILCCSGYELPDMEKSMQLLLSKKVDSIILIGSTYIFEKEEDNAYIAEAAKHIPIMLLNGTLNIPNVYGVLSNDFTSVYEATMYLLNAGTTDLLFFYNTLSYSTRNKMAGFCAAMEEKQLLKPHCLQQFHGSQEDIPGMVNHLQDLKNQGIPFNGIMACNDMLALGAVKYANETGCKIPDDLSIIGYNNSMLANVSEPPLTSIDNRPETLCEYLINTLMDVLENKEASAKTVFSTELVKRRTTK